MIWQLALPGPRIVNIRERRLKMTAEAYQERNSQIDARLMEFAIDAESSDEDEEVKILEETLPIPQFLKSSDIPLGITSGSLTPALLLVCKESYDFASKFYKVALSTFVSEPCIYFDFDRDTAYLRYNFVAIEQPLRIWKLVRHISYMFDSGDLTKVKNVAVPVTDKTLFAEDRDPEFDDEEWDMHDIIAACLIVFPHIETFAVIVEHDADLRDDSDLAFVDAIDIYGTIAGYKTFVGQYSYSRKPDPAVLRCSYMTISIAELEEAVSVWAETGFLALNIPEIVYKVAVPRKIADELKEWEIRAEKWQEILEEVLRDIG